jgi:hypothetical protein
MIFGRKKEIRSCRYLNIADPQHLSPIKLVLYIENLHRAVTEFWDKVSFKMKIDQYATGLPVP